jgi:hypothetical protein
LSIAQTGISDGGRGARGRGQLIKLGGERVGGRAERGDAHAFRLPGEEGKLSPAPAHTHMGKGRATRGGGGGWRSSQLVAGRFH